MLRVGVRFGFSLFARFCFAQQYFPDCSSCNCLGNISTLNFFMTNCFMPNKKISPDSHDFLDGTPATDRGAAAPAGSDFVDTLQPEWDAKFPDGRYKCVPSVTRIVRMSHYIAKAVDRNLAEFGLNRGEFELLGALIRSESQSLSPKVVQSRMLISSGALTNRIDRLEAKALIRREPDPDDRRGCRLVPTPKGIDLGLKAVASHMALEARLVSALTDKERRTLEALLKKLILSQDEELYPNSLR